MTKEKIDVEKLLEQLEAISEKLQSGDLSLQDSMNLYKEGIGIAKLLDKSLTKIASDIEILKEELKNITLNEEEA